MSKNSARRLLASSLGATLCLALGASALHAGHKDKHPKQGPHGKHGAEESKYFRRIATFPVFLNSDITEKTVSEIIDATEDGMTLVYTDAELEALGFVDISDPFNPAPLGTFELDGEPTSVKVLGDYALACINTSADFVNTSGELVVVQISTQTLVRSIPLGGQPDAIAISPDKRYAAIAIENERDEDLGDGEPPQLPAGKLVIVDLIGPPANWTTRDVDLTGIADVFPEDPEPEFVDINANNFAAITLQENNHIIIVHLPSGNVVSDFNAGSPDLFQVDIVENDLIEQNASLTDVPREADAIAWIGKNRLVTADEGDLFGGSRGFTIYNKGGKVLFTSGSADDQLMAMIGHYPENRSENKGNEPEGVAVADYDGKTHIFVGSERSSIVSVYCFDNPGRKAPKFLQVLVGGLGPEGLLAIPQRDLFVTASEEDDRGDKFRAAVTIYKRDAAEPTYPTVASEMRPDGTPIPWAALSALAADPNDAARAWTVYDSFYQKSRIFEMDVSGSPALITGEIVITDTNGLFAAAVAAAEDELDPLNLITAANLINADSTINVDPEGLARSAVSGFWLASEGNGTIGDPNRPIESLNWLFKVTDSGVIEQVVALPDATNALQVRFGFEGVAAVEEDGKEILYACIQREWAGDPDDHVRIARYDTSTGEWAFVYYPIELPLSANGGWVGLSEIVAISDTEFLVVERDNQGNVDAEIKRIYGFSIDGVTFKPEGQIFETVSKTLVADLLPALKSDNGFVIEKVEGLAVLANGEAVIVTDNDGVDDSSGETQFINLGPIDEL